MNPAHTWWHLGNTEKRRGGRNDSRERRKEGGLKTQFHPFLRTYGVMQWFSVQGLGIGGGMIFRSVLPVMIFGKVWRHF